MTDNIKYEIWNKHISRMFVSQVQCNKCNNNSSTCSCAMKRYIDKITPEEINNYKEKEKKKKLLELEQNRIIYEKEYSKLVNE